MTERTGWPPGMLQDDSRGLSKWLAGRLGARQMVRDHFASAGKLIVRNGCHNRRPLAAAYPKSNGQMLENVFAGKPCEYTKSALGVADNGCVGCKWREAK